MVKMNLCTPLNNIGYFKIKLYKSIWPNIKTNEHQVLALQDSIYLCISKFWFTEFPISNYHVLYSFPWNQRRKTWMTTKYLCLFSLWSPPAVCMLWMTTTFCLLNNFAGNMSEIHILSVFLWFLSSFIMWKFCHHGQCY